MHADNRTGRGSGLFSLLLGTFVFPLVLAGCGAGGGPEADQQNSPPVSTLSYSAQPGEIVMLRARSGAENSGTVSYQWNQMAGPPVMLGDARDRNAHFVMPPAGDGGELTFVVQTHHSSGPMTSEVHTVKSTPRPQHGTQPPVVTEQYVVFLADKDLDNRTDLYLAMLDGSAVYRLNGPLVPGGQVINFAISPDRRYVAYSADQDTDNIVELYVARADGGGATKVSGPLMPGGGVSDFAWAPNSSRVAYRAYHYTPYTVELFTSRPDGTGNVRISGALVAGGYVDRFTWAPNSSRIAYLAYQNTLYTLELFSSRADGTGNVRVSGPLVAGGYCTNFAWAPDGTRIAYAASQLTTRSFEIFTSYPDGSGNVRVSHPLPTDSDYVSGDIQWAPNGSRLAYRAYYYFSASGYFYYAENLFTTRPDGTGATQVSAVPLQYNQYRTLYQPAWAPNGSRIAYVAEQNTDNVFEVFSSGPDGGSNVQVSGSFVAGGSIFEFAWAPDSSRIAYRADQVTDNVFELFTSDPFGSGNVRVSGPLVTGGGVGTFAWAPDSRYLAYQADQLVDNIFELYTAAPDGTLNPRVSGAMVFNGNVSGFVWSANGARLVYRADQLVDEQYELFVAAPDGNAVNTNISGPLTANGDVFSFATQ